MPRPRINPDRPLTNAERLARRRNRQINLSDDDYRRLLRIFAKSAKRRGLDLAEVLGLREPSSAAQPQTQKDAAA